MYYGPSGYGCDDNNGQNKVEEVPVDVADEGDDKVVTVYRGTDKVAEQIVYDETGLIMSDSARKTYFETGDIDQAYATSQKTHEEWVEIWGDEDTYVQAHGEFGTVYELQVPESQLIPQTLKGAGESEFLIVNGTGG